MFIEVAVTCIPDTNLWFYGYETERRKLEPPNGLITLEKVNEGWLWVQVPRDPDQLSRLTDLFVEFDIDADYTLRVP